MDTVLLFTAAYMLVLCGTLVLTYSLEGSMAINQCPQQFLERVLCGEYFELFLYGTLSRIFVTVPLYSLKYNKKHSQLMFVRWFIFYPSPSNTPTKSPHEKATKMKIYSHFCQSEGPILKRPAQRLIVN